VGAITIPTTTWNGNYVGLASFVLAYDARPSQTVFFLSLSLLQNFFSLSLAKFIADAHM
jgi:hypothetical protein